jgi:hypothetical protein
MRIPQCQTTTLACVFILAVLAAAAYAQQPAQNTDRPGQNYHNFKPVVAAPTVCQTSCFNDTQCQAWVYAGADVGPNHTPMCWLKSGTPAAVAKTGYVSGLRTDRPQQPPTTVGGDPLGALWYEQESIFTSIWTRRGATNLFDAVYTSFDGVRLGTVHSVTLNGTKVAIKRIEGDKTVCDYEGTFGEGGLSGTYRCGSAQNTWKATVSAADQLFHFSILSSPENHSRCIDVPNGEFVPEKRLQVFDCNGTPAQNFTYDVSNKRISVGGLCVDGDKGQQGNPVKLLNCEGKSSQIWDLQMNGKYLQLVGVNGLCADITGGPANNKTPLQLSPCTGSPTQLWTLREAK